MLKENLPHDNGERATTKTKAKASEEAFCDRGSPYIF